MSVYFTEKEVATELRVSLASLRRWRVENRGPRFVKVGSLVRYSVRDLEDWLASLPSGGLSTKKEPQPARPRSEKFAS